MMNYYCTHSDKNYLAKGIAMCKSILEKDVNAVIYYLCLDDETYKGVLNYTKKEFIALSLVPVHIHSLEKFDKQLIELKNCKPSNYGTAYSQYCWALTPYLCWYLLHHELEEGNRLLYCDADLYFYKTPTLIFDACKHKSVGIHTHRFSSYDPETNDVGEFNVGCVYFKNDASGRKVSEFWKGCMLNPENQYAAKYGTCGDQKYLDLFIPLFGTENIAVFDRDTNPIIFHGAPWNFSEYDYNNGVNLVFNHFSHFKTDFNGNWSSSNHGEWAPENTHQKVKEFYINYNQKVTEANQLIQ